MGWLEKRLVIGDDPLPEKADAIIGVGIDVSVDFKSASPYSQAVAEKCLDLYQDGIADVILFTGGYPVGATFVEADAMAKVVADQIPPEHCLLERQGWRTYLNADYTREIALRKGWQTVIVVAQQWHARRVKMTFEKRWAGTGINIHVVKAWSGYGGGSQSRLNHFFTFALWDTLAFIISKLKGYC